MHLDRCPRWFQNEWREIMLKWHKAQRDCNSIRDQNAKRQTLELNRNIKATIQECWQGSGENHGVFADLVRRMERSIMNDIEEMVDIAFQARHGSGQGGYGQGCKGKGKGDRGGYTGGPGAPPPMPRSGHTFGRLAGGSGSIYRDPFRDEWMERDSCDIDPRHHHAATVHGVMHCKGGKPVRKGDWVKIDFGEMRNHVGQVVDIRTGGREGSALVVGKDRYGNEWEECFVARPNEYGRRVYPFHSV